MRRFASALLIGLLVIGAAAPPAAAQPSTAQGVIDAARRQLVERMQQGDCAQSTDPEEIVVCGRGQADDGSAAYRIPPSEDDSPRSRAGGEQMFALGIHDVRCTPIGFNQQCSGGLPILPMIFRIIETIKYQTSHD